MKKIIFSLSAIVAFSHVSIAQWLLTGNSATSSSFLGTTNNQPLVFKTGSPTTEWMRLTHTGYLGLGSSTPTAKLDLYLPSSFLTTIESGMRISYPVVSMPGSGVINKSIFEVREGSGTIFNSKFIVKSDGNVGIGTDAPSYKFHIKNASFSAGTAVRIDAINGHIRLFETDGVNPENFTQIERNGNAFHIYQKDAASPNFVHVLTAGMDGNVGFGDATSHPDAKIFVQNSDKNVGLFISNAHTTNNNYGLKCVVNNNTTRSLAVTNSVDGLDVFRVMGNGVVWCTELNVDVKGDFPDYVFDKKYKLLSLEELKVFIEKEKHLPNVPSAKEVAENGLAMSKMAVIQTEKTEELTLYILQLNEAIKKLNDQNLELQKRIVELESK